MKKFLFIILLLIPFLKDFAAPDSTAAIIHADSLMYASKLNIDNFEKIRTDIDTLLDGFQITNPLFKQDISFLYLGNYGTAAIPNHYFSRKVDDIPVFLSSYRNYFHLPFDCEYYNTEKPFTNISFSSGGNKKKRQETFRVIYARNLVTGLDAGFLLDHISARGQYQRQRIKLYAFTLFANYTNDKYSLFANWNLNSLEEQENGGIDESYISDSKTENIPVNLTNAQSKIKNSSLFLLQQYRAGTRMKLTGTGTMASDTARQQYIFKPKIQFSHVLRLENNKRGYRDEDVDLDFYPLVLVDSSKTFDSLYYRTLVNSVQFEVLEGLNSNFKMGGKLLFSNEAEYYGYNTPGVYSIATNPHDTVINSGGTFVFYKNDTTYAYPGEMHLTNNNRNIYYYTNNMVSASLFNRYGLKGNWDITGKYYVSGQKKGKYELKAKLFKAFNMGNGNESIKKDSIILIISAENKKEPPDYFFSEYYSNHLKWVNSFNEIHTSTLKFNLSKPLYRFEIGANYSLLKGYIYFDTLAAPTQENEAFSIWSAYLFKHFVFGNFHFKNKLIFQQTDNKEVMRFPEFMGYNSSYFDRFIHFKSTGGTIYFQIGFDVSYCSGYYADLYFPPLGGFYQQNLLIENPKKIGDYPCFDVFLNLKIKRLRLLLKYDHINAGLISDRYFSAPHYPMNRRVFKLGLSWSFYD